MRWFLVQTAHISNPSRHPEGKSRRDTYTDAAGKAVGRKLHLKLELVYALLETAVSAENRLVFKQRRKAISQILSASSPPPGTKEPQILRYFTRRNGVLEHLDKTM